MNIAGLGARIRQVALTSADGTSQAVRLYEVDDLERYVDVGALLGERDPVDPPYWALVWSGAEAVARALMAGPSLVGQTVLDLGAGLGLAGVAAALRGARVCFADRCPEALAYAAASAAANGLVGWDCVQLDFTSDQIARRFDRILAADVVYDRAHHAALASFLERHLAHGGSIWLTDRLYVATDAFFADMCARGFADDVEDLVVPEMGETMKTRLHRLTRQVSVGAPAAQPT